MPEKQIELGSRRIEPKDTRHIYTVSEIAQDIKLVLESCLGQVWIEGEVSNFQAHTSGHFYFTLKDDAAVMPAAMFAWANRDVKFKLENGLKVICFGKVSCYGPRGQYQIIVEKIEPKGIGSLQLALEELKQKLQKEGLFSPEHKKPIPYLPSCIGVVTSLSGAAIKDILKVIDRRFSDIHIIIYPVQVQGEGAKEVIAQAVIDFNLYNQQLPPQEKVEVLIVGRGGGSMEDLWAFNEEVVARAIYASKVPVISAVGHERDITVADLVADYRAPTPSVAAEVVAPKKEDLRQRLEELGLDLKRSFLEVAAGRQDILDDLAHRLDLSMENIWKLSAQEFQAAKKKLSLLNPALLIQQHIMKMQDLSRQVQVRMGHFWKLRQARFNTAVEKLSSLSPLNILGRGYSITFKVPEGLIVKEAKAVRQGDAIRTKLSKGEILSQVTEVK